MASKEMIAMLGNHLLLIIQARRAAREEGRHYNGFLVGAAVSAIMPNGSTNVFTGANNSPYKGAPKYCAERKAVERAKAAGAVRIVAMAVVGPLKSDDESGKMGMTLHPCGVCRNGVLRDSLIDNGSVIITVQFNNGDDIDVEMERAVIEVHSLMGILSFHNCV